MRTYKRIYLNIGIILTLVFAVVFAQAQNTFELSGIIINEAGEPLVDAFVFLEEEGGVSVDTSITDEEGYYQFTVVEGANYTITPYKNTDFLNGVGTYDLVLLSQHIEGTNLLGSPYQMIAADINHSDFIDTTDLADLSELLMFNFPNNTSWRFIDASFVFPNSMNPWASAFPEAIFVNSVGNDLSNLNFIAVKIGDLNANDDYDPCEFGCGLISGNVFYDADLDCMEDPLENKLENWIIVASDPEHTFYGVSNSLGHYVIPTYPGDFTVHVFPPNELWTPCESSYDVTVVDQETITLNLPINANAYCPEMSVDLVTPFIRRCFNGTYVVKYCNQGTMTAIDASVEVNFDSYLTINSSVPDWTTGSGNTYTWQLGDIGIGECGTINVNYTTSCDSILGQTLCSEAHVFPDSICPPVSPLWDESNLEITSSCDSDSVRFQITNMGSDMSQAVELFVVEDDMIMMSAPIILDELATEELAFPANGSTWRLEVEQSPYNPFSQILSEAIEGCGVNADGSFSLGFVTQFPIYPATESIDVDCKEVIGSYDPNDKSASIKGFGEEHFIKENVDLEYLIRFQNTGTDTAFTVLIKDTLSQWLNMETIRPGASSHNYDFELLEGNVVQFLFPNILLPDSNVNEAASHGFIQFEISQKVNNPIGTVINNDAAIYFDFNDPVITNTVFHTIGEDFIDHVSFLSEPTKNIKLNLFPNPIYHSARLTLTGQSLKEGTFVLYDLLGQKLRQKSFSGSGFTLQREGLSSGLYLFEIREGGERLGTGKLMVR